MQNAIDAQRISLKRTGSAGARARLRDHVIELARAYRALDEPEQLVECAVQLRREASADPSLYVEAARVNTWRPDGVGIESAIEDVVVGIRAGFRDFDLLLNRDFDGLRDDTRIVELLTAHAAECDQSWRTDRERTSFVQWRWLRGVSGDSVDAAVTEGWRVVDVEVESLEPVTFTVILVEDIGAQAGRGVWSHGLDMAKMIESSRGVLLTDVAGYSTAEGERFASISVPRPRNARVGGWYFGDLRTVRRIGRSSRVLGGSFHAPGRLAVALAGNNDRMRREWRCLDGLDEAGLAAAEQDGWRVYAIQRDPQNNSLSCVVVRGLPIESWYFCGLDPDRIESLAAERHARLVEVNPWLQAGGRRVYDGVMIRMLRPESR